MKIEIRTPDRLLAEQRQSLERSIRLGLTRFCDQITRINLTVRDQNGPRRGCDQRCVLVITLRGAPEICIQETSPSLEQAVLRAVGRAARCVARGVERRQRSHDCHGRRTISEVDL